jgi:hypothetical protein
VGQTPEARAEWLIAEVNEDELYTPSERQVMNKLLHGDAGQRQISDAREKDKDRQALYDAYRIRDEIQAKSFFRLRITRHYQLILLTLGIPVLFTTLGLIAAYSDSFNDTSWKRSWMPVFLSALLGVLGAIVSAGQRSTRMHPTTIADQMGAWVASISRVPIGAVAGLSVWLFSLAAVGDDVQSLKIGNVFLAAFAAGFAERLSVQGVRPQSEQARSKQ